MTGYNIPAQPVEVEEVIKNSQFITRVRCVDTADQAKAFIRELNQLFPDATHHCWAYIVGAPDATTLIGCSDDGEPSGTAGKPMLNVLQHADIGDIVVVCTRYYGGTKLGTGGLTRAYGGGVKLALEVLETKVKIDYTLIGFELEYSQLKDCEYVLKDYQIQNHQLDYQTTIIVSLEIATEELAEFKLALENKLKGQIKWNTTP